MTVIYINITAFKSRIAVFYSITICTGQTIEYCIAASADSALFIIELDYSSGDIATVRTAYNIECGPESVIITVAPAKAFFRREICIKERKIY